jgi:oxygen-independent coproporphyrinogen-3 oxidase
MAGIYIHIPFCATRCIYCDFFSSTDASRKVAFREAACRELAMRRDYLKGEKIRTVYFGGGTPSQLAAADFAHIFDTIGRYYDVSDCEEITLEANPDDMTAEYVASLRSLPFNRISMGVQSFDATDLHFLNRRHTREQAIQAVSLCRENGIENISIDLIYGLPGRTVAGWTHNLDEAIALDVPHISAYHLIYEEGTPLNKLRMAGKVVPVDELVSEELFNLLIDRLEAAGYLHYEISNFARPGYFSKHNSSYWNETKYLGIGPSAHSYDGGKPAVECGFDRTLSGIRLGQIESCFGEAKKSFCQQQAARYINQGLIIQQDDRPFLSRRGIFISDHIMSDLLWV